MSKSSKARKAKAVELVSKYVPRGGKVLEVSCGKGEELERLKALGYQVKGTNFTKYDEVSEVEIDHGVDLIEGLPYEDNSFDGVVLLDVMEHLNDHDRALCELARVCRSGGHLLVMTPNIMKITSRLNFLFTGFFKLKRAFIGFDVPHESAFAFHNYPVHVPTFLYQMKSHHLHMVEFAASVYKPKSFAFLALLFPIISVMTAMKLYYGEKNLKGTDAAKQLFRSLTSIAGLCGEFWFIVARKTVKSEEQKTGLPRWSKKFQ